MLTLKISMLGEFSIRSDGNEVTQIGTRSRRNWSLLAYLIYNRNQTVSADKIIELLWGEEEKSSDPMNALKAALHRLRANLNKLGEDAGHTLINSRVGGYTWNNDIPFSLDVEEFEQLCRKGENADSAEQKLLYWEKALELYKGDFLPLLSSESWVIPIASYYHNLFVHTAQEFLTILEKEQQYQKIISIGHSIIAYEPYQEELYGFLIRALCKAGDFKSAVAVYNEMRTVFFDNFGVLPSEEIQAVYRTALSNIDDVSALPLGTVVEQLREEHTTGAFVCDFDVFKHIYRAQARHIIRSGNTIHIALFTLSAKNGKPTPKQKIDTAMNHFGNLITSRLRHCDIIARCSLSQFVVMLNLANYEDSLALCSRLSNTFRSNHPHSSIQLSYAVSPVEPN